MQRTGRAILERPLTRAGEAIRARREPLHAAVAAAIAMALGSDAAKLEEKSLAWGGPHGRGKESSARPARLGASRTQVTAERRKGS